MIIVDVEQGTQEWLNLKAGVPSASNFAKIVTSTGAKSKTVEKYIHQLAGERITGIREEGYQNASMKRGIEMEQEAVNAYEALRDVDTEKVGIVYKDDTKSVLCSPDRLIGAISDAPSGLLEIKCPEIQTHVSYLLENRLPSKYFQQVQGQMYITGAVYCDFMSYYPGLKPLVVRVERDESFIEKLREELVLVCAELEVVIDEIK